MRPPRPQYSGYKQSAKWRIKKAKQMIKWEEEAKKQGIPVARLIAQQLELEELTRLKEQTQKEEEALEISRGVDISDYSQPD